MLATAGLRADLEALIVRKAEGNPFFVEEVVKAFRDLTASPSDGLSAPRRRLQELVVPDAVQDVITARIDRLDAASKKTLQAASVVGRQFSLGVLQRTLEAADGIEPHLEPLKRLEFVYEQGFFPEREYTFKHALTQEVAYEGLLVKRRQAPTAFITSCGVLSIAPVELLCYSEQKSRHLTSRVPSSPCRTRAPPRHSYAGAPRLPRDARTLGLSARSVRTGIF